MSNVSRFFAFATLSLLSSAALAADDFAQLDAAVRAIEGHSARFEHLFRPHGSEHEIVEKGSVLFGTLPEMRWTYAAPDQKTFVFDGRTSWLYVPAEKQVSVHQLTAEEREELPFLLLKDESRAKKNFEIHRATRDGRIQIRLEPKSDTRIRSLIVSVDTRTSRICTLEYEDLEGNYTRFSFDSYRESPPERAQFRFTPPAGVEVVEY